MTTRAESAERRALEAWLAAWPRPNAPASVCPAVAAFVRALRDWMHHDEREQLAAYLERLIGTVVARDGFRRRGWIAADFALRRAVALALDLADLPALAATLRALAPVMDAVAGDVATRRLAAVRTEAGAAANRNARIGPHVWAAGVAACDAVVAVAAAAREDAAAAADAAGWAIARPSAHVAPELATRRAPRVAAGLACLEDMLAVPHHSQP